MARTRTRARSRSAPHRFSLDDTAPAVARVNAAEALRRVTADGLDGFGADDLEVYRLVMSPAEFRRFELRLTRAVAESWEAIASPPAPTGDPTLPFGTDLDLVCRAEEIEARRRSYADRPNGEAFPTTWTIHDDLTIPGRLKLISGREFSVWGFRGRLLFRHAVTTIDGDCWVDGWDEDGRCRSITPDRIRTVHRTTRRRHPHGDRR